jgi:hypothetical protein
MTLANMRELGVRRLIASCLDDACRHTALADVSSYPADTDMPSFLRRAKCGKRVATYGPNRKEQRWCEPQGPLCT